MKRITHLSIMAALGAVIVSPSMPLRAQEGPAETLAFELLEGSATESPTVSFQWAGAPDLVLQRSSSLNPEEWTTLLATRGQSAFVEDRQDLAVFYRLVRLPESDATETTLAGLEWRLTEMNVNQIQRAVDAVSSNEAALGETPPDDGDGAHSFNLFNSRNDYAWATQPGLIRVYSVNGFERGFKLYSSKDSVASSAEDLANDAEGILAWQSDRDRFTDLNEPIAEEDGGKRYPILDPRALAAGVEGFDYAADATLGTVPNEALPMPAEWLYVLKDGSLGTLNASGNWEGEGEATETNPIVARMAYWGDDETTKLNVNVASEGIPWDMPRADTPKEREYAARQPVKGEIQRYPGHPAMTSLSSVLFPGKSADHTDETKRLTDDELRTIFALTPRAVLRGGGGNSLEVSLQLGDRVPLEHDADPWRDSTSAWATAARELGMLNADHLEGFVTTRNPSPEITVHGMPRMSVWPVHETGFRNLTTDYDRRSIDLTSLGSREYHFNRRDASSRHGEIYNRDNRRNMARFGLIMDQTYLGTPGYGKPLAHKYGARRPSEDYESDEDYDKDHYAIALSMFDRIRTTNIADPNVEEPYVSSESNLGTGIVSSMNLIGRELDLDNGSSQNSANWHRPTLEPQGAGRNYTLSEVALVAYGTGEVTIRSWDGEEPTFMHEAGPDTNVMKNILSNEHPGYSRVFGKEDVGKTFIGVEVGLIPELFSPSQSYPRKRPRHSVRLLTGGAGYRGGVSVDMGLKLNGESLAHWGDAQTLAGQRGPLISTVESGLQTNISRLPLDWRSTGGAGGPRLLQFGRFEVKSTQEGFYGNEFLANGIGPLSHWYCQNLIVIEKGDTLTFSQDAPIQFVLYDQDESGATTGNAVRLFHVRFAQPGASFEVPGPERGSPAYAGWTRRFRTASSAGTPLSDPTGAEAIKGMSVAHGDYRHLALKRVIPSELFTHHPLAESDRSSHSLTWATSGGVDSEETAKQGPESIGRSLVEGVQYARDVLPDFVQDPARRGEFAPLLGENYRFPIDPTITRDFDNGLGNVADGPYINSADEGDDLIPGGSIFNPKYPYFDLEPVEAFKMGGVSASHSFARRMIISPVSFGSIPSAMQANAPWTCLLFRPNISSLPHLGEPGHGMVWERNRTTLEGFEIPQLASVTGDETFPPDHVWLDYFWMPAAEPVRVSSPLATEGKVNMNYQLFPYTYIKRATALHAALKGEEILAIPTEAGPTYKTSQENPNWRHRIDAAETLKQFEETFAKGEIFMSESEICEQFLIPEGQTWDGDGAAMRAFWDAHRLSGDNTLERPYAGLYSRLTTRSNAFRLHYRIQTITKGGGSEPGSFDPDKDAVTADHRGAKVIERVLDAQSSEIPNYLSGADVEDMARLERFYTTVVHDVR